MISFNNLMPVGTFGGMMLGCAVNLWRNKSFFLFESNYNSSFNGFAPSVIINTFRENDFQYMKQNFLRRITPFHISCPMIHVIPSLSYIIWNTIQDKKDGKADLKDNFCHRLNKGLIYPFIHSFSLLGIRILVEKFVTPHFLKLNIDVSGHAWHQISLTMHAINSFKGVEENGTINQKKFYGTLNTIILITDAIWTYNTAANHHSVADIASGAGLACLTHFCLEKVGL